MLGAGPSRALYPRPIFTNKFHLSSLHSYQTSRDIRSESRATRTPCHPIAPTSSSRRLRERKIPILFQLSPSKCNHFPAEQCTPSFLFWDRSTVSETPCDRIESTPLEGVSLLPVAWSIVAANCCG